MPGIGIGELVVIFLLLLVFVGPTRLPAVARTLGRAMGEVRRATDELKNALYLEDVRQRRPRSTAPTPRAAGAVQRPSKATMREVELPDEGPAVADPYSPQAGAGEPAVAEDPARSDDDPAEADEP